MTRHVPIAWTAILVLLGVACGMEQVGVERQNERSAPAVIDGQPPRPEDGQIRPASATPLPFRDRANETPLPIAPVIVTATPPPTPSTITASSIVPPVVPWPPAPEREKIVRLALDDPETLLSLQGHRYLVLTVNSFNDKEGPCSERITSCAEVGIYDYTAATGRKVVVDFVAWKVVARWAAPDFSGGFSEEEQAELAAIVAADERVGTEARIDLGWVKQIDDTDLGGKCGSVTPRHRCLTVHVRHQDGSEVWVSVDMVERRVIRVSSN